MAMCTQCGATIRWVSTQTGRRLPLDATPAPWSVRHSWVLEGEVARLADLRRDHSSVPRYRNHWAMCTHAVPPPAAVGTAPTRAVPARGPDRRVPDRGSH